MQKRQGLSCMPLKRQIQPGFPMKTGLNLRDELIVPSLLIICEERRRPGRGARAAGQ